MSQSHSQAVIAIKAKYLLNKIHIAAQKYHFVMCDTPELIKVSQNIRYNVYCKELGWQAASQHHCEKDRYDPLSIHYVVFDRITGQAIATFRIITGSYLPVGQIEHFNIAHPHHPSRTSDKGLCEISRFSILQAYRNSELNHALILFAAYAAIRHGFSATYSMMESKFAKKLKKFHILVSQLTDTFEHRGKRAIYLICHSHVLPLLSAMAHGDCSITGLDKVFAKLSYSQQQLRYCA